MVENVGVFFNRSTWTEDLSQQLILISFLLFHLRPEHHFCLSHISQLNAEQTQIASSHANYNISQITLWLRHKHPLKHKLKQARSWMNAGRMVCFNAYCDLLFRKASIHTNCNLSTLEPAPAVSTLPPPFTLVTRASLTHRCLEHAHTLTYTHSDNA